MYLLFPEKSIAISSHVNLYAEKIDNSSEFNKWEKIPAKDNSFYLSFVAPENYFEPNEPSIRFFLDCISKDIITISTTKNLAFTEKDNKFIHTTQDGTICVLNIQNGYLSLKQIKNIFDLQSTIVKLSENIISKD